MELIFWFLMVVLAVFLLAIIKELFRAITEI